MKHLILIQILIIFTSLSNLKAENIELGADQVAKLVPFLKNKNVALVVNHTSCQSDGTHLLEALLAHKINVTKILAPEHGFRGDEDAGKQIKNGKDIKTGLPVVSLYGKNKKPSPTMLSDIDVVILDIQDVGARFYTYISTMYYVLEACAENNKKIIVLDRPNPNDYIDGPVLNLKYKSFVGIMPIPILHGLTIGELAQMANGEGWLNNKIKADLLVLPLKGWKHGDPYSLPIKPSPNLPNDRAIELYPSLCFFEATQVSVGRGTYFPFQVIGYPNPRFGKFRFIPRSLKGFDINPIQKDKLCYGIDLRNMNVKRGLTLSYLIDFYNKSGKEEKFFSSPQFMNLLSGTNKLQQQIKQGLSEEQIKESWQKDLNRYKIMRKKYILYQDKDYD